MYLLSSQLDCYNFLISCHCFENGPISASFCLFSFYITYLGSSPSPAKLNKLETKISTKKIFLRFPIDRSGFIQSRWFLLMLDVGLGRKLRNSVARIGKILPLWPKLNLANFQKLVWYFEKKLYLPTLAIF